MVLAIKWEGTKVRPSSEAVFVYVKSSFTQSILNIIDFIQPLSGYGWAATVEILCTALQSGPWGEDICTCGTLFVVYSLFI